MKITTKLKQQHDVLLEELRESMFYEGFGTKNPNTFVKHVRCLNDIYAYFMRYDVKEDPNCRKREIVFYS